MNQDNIAWHVWLGVILSIIPATIVVPIRFYARTHGSEPAGLQADDWLILAALVVNWCMAAIRFNAIVEDGYGVHASQLSTSTVSDFQKSFLAVQQVYFLNAALTKCSILFLYHRIFGISHRFTVILWATGTLVVTYFIICVCVSIFGCVPVSYFWDKAQTGHCINEVEFFRGNGIVNMLLDVLILCLPLPMVWRLDLGLQQKIAVTGIFGLGTFVCLVSIMRIVAFAHSNQNDPTYTTVDTAMWSSIEQSIGIVCTCLPTLRPLLLWIWKWCPGSSRPTPIPLQAMGKEGRDLQQPPRSSPSERRILQSSEELGLKQYSSASGYDHDGHKIEHV
ncbi:hypothetical protein N0V93_003692 [Gnomoniopsis smithogilvyi]|uniref:Rhodopsin domain-containing protein n=1 Tax=Gnomoniopsis smithogilvyi TaxID=1191159 RepID=A0A9W8YX50_9PEZI|nr:hypothetical protein N0V93_003692 [Gnomoniopsis smithogilvyi]